MSTARRVAGPLLMAVVLAAALLVGSGIFDSAAPGEGARIAALWKIVRCPSCTNLSVAQSNAPSSVAVRNEIAQKVHAGRTDDEILNTLQDRYGASILLVPPAGALTTVLWAAPVVLAVGALVAGVVAISRRRARVPA
jgi:cytochrome c-type biogenesis protein CcmH